MMYPQTKVWQRRRDVTSLLVRGVSRDEMAEMLQTRKHTIDNDIRVILSGKNKALSVYTHKQVIAQLRLNAMERAKYLWRIVEEAEKNQVKVNALRELRLNDERITAKLLAFVKDDQESEEDEFDKEAMLEEYQDLYKRVEALKERRIGMEEIIRERVEKGDLEGLRSWIANTPELTEG